MTFGLWLLIGAGTGLCLALALVGSLAWRHSPPAERALIKRIMRLPFKSKLRLGVALFRDPRIPLLGRAIPPLLLLYLALPIDFIPDFIPVLGHLDDLVVLVLGVGLLLRLTPAQAIEEAIAHLEAGP